jgi:hypothetical protein
MPPSCTGDAGGQTVAFDAGGCVPIPAGMAAVMMQSVSAQAPVGGCTADGGAPTGTATASQPVTVCCTQ